MVINMSTGGPQQLSIIILNFSRPKVLRHLLLPLLLEYDVVGEVVLSHGKASARFALDHPKVTHLDHVALNESHGLSCRFVAASQARFPYVAIMDDDLLPWPVTLKALLACAIAAPGSIHGLHGRSLSGTQYTTETWHGPCHMVLTRCLVAARSHCVNYLQHFREHETALVRRSKPYWNGEDILFSLLTTASTGQLHMAYDFAHTNLHFDVAGEAISSGRGHGKYRDGLVKEVVPRLGFEAMPPLKSSRGGKGASYDAWHSCWVVLVGTTAIVGLTLYLVISLAARTPGRSRQA